MDLKITALRILHRAIGSDIVWLETNKPEGIYPYTGFLTLEFQCARGMAETYCGMYFPGIPVSEVVTQQRHDSNFSKRDT